MPACSISFIHVKKKSQVQCLDMVDSQRCMLNIGCIISVFLPSGAQSSLLVPFSFSPRLKTGLILVILLSRDFFLRTWIDFCPIRKCCGIFFPLGGGCWVGEQEGREGGRWRILSVIVLIPEHGLYHLTGLPHFSLHLPLTLVLAFCFKIPRCWESLFFVFYSEAVFAQDFSSS